MLFTDPAIRPPIPAVQIDPRTGIHILEDGFPLDAPSDADLDAAGISLWARVSWVVYPDEDQFDEDAFYDIVKDFPELDDALPRSQLVFRRGDAEGKVNCIHLAVYSAPLDELVKYRELSENGKRSLPVDFSTSTEKRTLSIAPEEQFRALRSYVEGVTSVGVRALLTSGEQPGFDELWHYQVRDALQYVLPVSGVDDPIERDAIESLQRKFRFSLHQKTSVNFATFGFMTRDTRVRGIALPKRELTRIPAEIALFTGLERLYLRENRLTHLPDFLTTLTRLSHLDVGKNRLLVLPENIGHLAKLTYLDLRLNQIDALPETIGNLERLRTLRLEGNRIQELPESIENLTALETLSLDSNDFREISGSISRFRNLTHLSLSENALTAIPASIGELTKLKSLRLSHNALETLPESITNLKNLQILGLDNNPMQAHGEPFKTWIKTLLRKKCYITFPSSFSLRR